MGDSRMNEFINIFAGYYAGIKILFHWRFNNERVY